MIAGLIGVIAVGLTVLVPGLAGWGLLLAWLAAVNIITFMVYRYDKAIAGGSQMRAPERILLLLAAAGGSPAAYAAMFMMRERHKTRKGSFQLAYWTIVAVQGVGVVIWLLRM